LKLIDEEIYPGTHLVVADGSKNERVRDQYSHYFNDEAVIVKFLSTYIQIFLVNLYFLKNRNQSFGAFLGK